MYIHRTIEKELANLNKNFKVLLVSGMRQVGKSTVLAHSASENRQYVTLDENEDLELAQSAPKAFFLKHPLPLTIDEIQRAPGMFLQIKAQVDRTEQYGQVWLTGSQRFSLMKGVGDSLAGRLFEVHLMPLSIYEREGKGLLQEPFVPSLSRAGHLKAKSPEETWDLIWQGAWPRLLNFSPKERSQFFEGFLTTLLDRDIREVGNVDSLLAFRRFIRALALRTGQELRIGALAQLSGVSEPTVKRWLSIAHASGLIYLLAPFFSNKNKSLVKSPKIYFADTGFAAWLCGFSTAGQLRQDSAAGAFFETFAVIEILKSWRHNGVEPDLFFYRDAKTKAEIDLLIHENGLWHPVEIKMSAHPDKGMIRHFSEFEKLNLAAGDGALISLAPEKRFLSDTVVAQSIWDI